MTKRYANKNVIIVGLGQTGLSCVRFFCNQQATVTVVDTREQPPALSQMAQQYPQVPFVAGLENVDWFEAELIVVSPGVPLVHPGLAAAKEAGIEICGDVEIFAQCVTKPVVAITGSNGKSTVTTLMGVMARDAGMHVAVAGNIGIPVLDVLDDENTELYVLELSSFQLETTYSLKPKAAVVLNVSEDHMDRYDSMESYAKAKAVVYQGAETCVVNADDPRVTDMGNVCETVVNYSTGENADYRLLAGADGQYLAIDHQALMPVNQMKMRGLHNASNALAALALGKAVGLPLETMLETLAEFPGLPHRVEWVKAANGVDWYNDSKATNVGATQAAVAGFDAPIVLIAGGQGKGQDFTELHQVIAEKTKALVLFGEDADQIAQGVPDSVAIYRVASMSEAVEKANAVANQGDVVLLSPACASFDMFKGFEDRGEQFCKAVEGLAS